MAEFRMPALGADMEAGTIVEWLVKPGDKVKRGDIIAVVDTEKATIEVEVFEAGLIQSIVVPAGEKVPIGTVLASIATDDEAAPALAPRPPSPAKPPEIVRPAFQPIVPAPPIIERPPSTMPPVTRGRLRVSPLAMRVALDLGVDLSKVKGTGPDGAITKSDVERAAKSVPPPPPPAAPSVKADKAGGPSQPVMTADERHVAMRKVIAAAMVRSKHEIPHYYLGTPIDMSHSMGWLQAENLRRPVAQRLLYSVLLLKAAAVAIRDVPEMNGFWIDGAFKPGEAVHVGVAIALRQGGLIAPALHDVDKKSLDEIMANLRDLVNRVRAGTLRSSEIADATITVTSLGERGVESVFGVIYPPQVAIVGFGKIAERPWAVDGLVGARPVVAASLAADHRVSDGHRGALFLAAIDRLLQEPEKL
ncbi:MAG TPA: dihydrolipoamide acetyltransferase family protein [Candidatus Binataceae bacterium]|nr:dihydrolipoamide acetyltransferase family protein [Candidatus Binataceae bacterium]